MQLSSLDSDFIFSDGSFAHIHEQRIAGKKAYAAMHLRLVEDDAAPILKEHLPKPLTPRQLVRIGMDNMHNIQRSMFFDAETPSSIPIRSIGKSTIKDLSQIAFSPIL